MGSAEGKMCEFEIKIFTLVGQRGVVKLGTHSRSVWF